MSLDNNSITLIVNFLLTVAGTGIGVFLAFLGDDFREKRSERKDTRRILNLLIYELTKNLAILDVIKKALDSFGIPYEHLSSSIYEGISNKIDLLADNILLYKVDTAYHQFAVLEDAMKTYREDQLWSLNQPDAEAKESIKAVVKEEGEAIVEHLTITEKSDDMFSITRRAISALEMAIKALS